MQRSTPGQDNVEWRMHPTDKEAAREALLGLTARVVEAYLGKNQLAASKLGDVIRTVHGSLAKVQEETNGPQSREPAVPVKASVTPDYLVCLEDGRKVKMLRRYLRKAYRMSPIEYRTRWGLPADYPMVAPNYAKTRSLLAKRIGLGHHPRKVTN